jgi:hypothetical protein
MDRDATHLPRNLQSPGNKDISMAGFRTLDDQELTGFELNEPGAPGGFDQLIPGQLGEGARSLQAGECFTGHGRRR